MVWYGTATVTVSTTVEPIILRKILEIARQQTDEIPALFSRGIQEPNSSTVTEIQFNIIIIQY